MSKKMSDMNTAKFEALASMDEMKISQLNKEVTLLTYTCLLVLLNLDCTNVLFVSVHSRKH